MIKMQNKYNFAANLIKHDSKNVLDVGCRKKEIKDCLSKNVRYQGLDFMEGDEVIACNLENGIPLENKSFDLIFALDILEHVENVHFLFEEMLRVAKKEVIIALPNEYHWSRRLKFLLGKDLLYHHIFFKEKTIDRHRWITSYYSSCDFVKFNAKNYKVEVFNWIYVYQKFRFFYKIDKFFSKFWPNLFVCATFFRIDLTDRQKLK
ncbi:MAG: hypothetical protein A2528_01725 [Candidatus Staskawiczbacteria bacterium RIFOXYD2_FULL_37_9]|nr:MAG: hypothetical protein A2581_03115 [Candidatus Staskawiczbacteria bacterium RIFOXYD1_FULL_37_110]OGZ93544.1 MAG: hypothetical protein A2528_01725 [Candidatus Staskawiczbacteria bacterium RIFOXYD2_FULL_37_9]